MIYFSNYFGELNINKQYEECYLKKKTYINKELARLDKINVIEPLTQQV